MKDSRGYGRDPDHGHFVGKTASPTYESWRKMMTRCYNPRSVQFPYYGGRGIRVDVRWHDFRWFLADMGERPDGMCLGRQENDKGYGPGNCRWEDRLEQARNRRNVKWVEFGGRRLTLKEFADEVGLVPSVMYNRLGQGWTLEQTVAYYSIPGNCKSRRIRV